MPQADGSAASWPHFHHAPRHEPARGARLAGGTAPSLGPHELAIVVELAHWVARVASDQRRALAHLDRKGSILRHDALQTRQHLGEGRADLRRVGEVVITAALRAAVVREREKHVSVVRRPESERVQLDGRVVRAQIGVNAPPHTCCEALCRFWSDVRLAIRQQHHSSVRKMLCVHGDGELFEAQHEAARKVGLSLCAHPLDRANGELLVLGVHLHHRQVHGAVACV
mmetsp:Transcript_104799/g.302342  ORF Transcript_104799/g.302342 Transcript_104799/m.302342 type:complete len:227 (+) Transcript_104799:1745-2425(+)